MYGIFPFYHIRILKHKYTTMLRIEENWFGLVMVIGMYVVCYMLFVMKVIFDLKHDIGCSKAITLCDIFMC